MATQNHDCDTKDSYCLDALDLGIPAPGQTVATRGISDDVFNQALAKAKTRAQRETGYTPPQGVSTRSVGAEGSEPSLDAVISVDYYNYERQYGVNPLTQVASIRTSPDTDITFVWDDQAFKGLGVTDDELTKMKAATQRLYELHRQFDGPPLTYAGDRTITVKPMTEAVATSVGGDWQLAMATSTPIFDSQGSFTGGDTISIRVLDGANRAVWSQPNVYFTSDMAHELSHAWRAHKTFLKAESRQIEEGLARFEEKLITKYIFDHSEEKNRDYFNIVSSSSTTRPADAEPDYFTSSSHSNLSYYDAIYSKVYDGPMDTSSSAAYVNVKYELGGAAIAKLYLTNNDFLKNLHGIIDQNNATAITTEIKNWLTEATGESRVVDGQLARDFVRDLPLFRNTATAGKYVVNLSAANDLILIDKDSQGMATKKTPFPSTGKLHNSFGWAEDIDTTLMETTDPNVVKDVTLTVSPNTILVGDNKINYGQFEYDIDGYKSGKLVDYTVAYGTKYSVGDIFQVFSSDGFFSRTRLNYLITPPGAAEPVLWSSYLAEQQGVDEAKISSGDLLAVVDATGNALEAKFYCNNNLLETKPIFGSFAADQYSNGPTSLSGFLDVYYISTFSSQGCSGYATVVVKKRERGNSEHTQWGTGLTIDGGHIFTFDPKDPRWTQYSPISDVTVASPSTGKKKITFNSSAPVTISLRCTDNPRRVLGTWTIKGSGRQSVNAKSGSRTGCWFQSSQPTGYDAPRKYQNQTSKVIKSATFNL